MKLIRDVLLACFRLVLLLGRSPGLGRLVHWADADQCWRLVKPRLPDLSAASHWQFKPLLPNIPAALAPLSGTACVVVIFWLYSCPGCLFPAGLPVVWAYRQAGAAPSILHLPPPVGYLPPPVGAGTPPVGQGTFPYTSSRTQKLLALICPGSAACSYLFVRPQSGASRVGVGLGALGCVRSSSDDCVNSFCSKNSQVE